MTGRSTGAAVPSPDETAIRDARRLYETAFTGNPLAVVLEAEGSTRRDATIAREFNFPRPCSYSRRPNRSSRAKSANLHAGERAAIRGASDRRHGGAARRADGGGEQTFTLERRSDSSPVASDRPVTNRGHASFDLPRLPAKEADGPAGRTWRLALGLTAADLGLDDSPRRDGPPATRSRACRCRPRRDGAMPRRSRRFDEVFGGSGPGAAFLFCRETRESRSRVSCPHVRPGVRHARGSGHRVGGRRVRRVPRGSVKYADGQHVVVIEQGYEMGRPSVLELTLEIAAAA